MSVNWSARFKKDEREYDGLTAIVKDLIDADRKHDTHIVVAVVGTKFIKEDVDGDGTMTPTVKIHRVEPLTGDDAVVAQQMLDNAFRARTGRTQPTLFDNADPPENGDQPAEEKDPTAGPWPGDVDFKAPE